MSPTAGISSENEDQSRRRESKETNEIDSPIAFSPSDTSVTSSVFTSGSNVSGRSTYTFSSIGVLSPRERISSSISTQGTVNPFYTKIQYNDKTRSNDTLNGTLIYLKMKRAMTIRKYGI